MGDAKRNAASLEDQLLVLEDQMDEMKDSLVADGAPVIVIVYADKVVRPAFEAMLRAHHRKVPVSEIDEAIVSSLSSIIFDYLQRVHPKGERVAVLDHLNLIGQDVTERIVAQVVTHFDDKPKLIILDGTTRH